ncbi:hypothetical protein DL767_008826 [Monosporascus sp. MG133]|nr:hypothetical protein DL767_008826 [Monosporascus sp. MG133]
MFRLFVKRESSPGYLRLNLLCYPFVACRAKRGTTLASNSSSDSGPDSGPEARVGDNERPAPSGAFSTDSGVGIGVSVGFGAVIFADAVAF